jgi:hypothetical protein
MEKDLESYSVLWHDARWRICINVLKGNLYLFTKLHGVTSYKTAISYPAMIIQFLTFSKLASVIFITFLTIAICRVYQNYWSGLEVDYIHKYGEETYK